LNALPTGIAIENHEPIVYSSRQHNVRKALAKRCLAERPPMDDAFVARFFKFINDNVHDILGFPHDAGISTDLDEQDRSVSAWIEGCNSSLPLKKKYAATWCAMRAEGWSMYSDIPDDLAKDWTKREITVKRETSVKDEHAFPRQILSAAPQLVVMTAPFLSRVAGLLKKHWDGVNSCIVFAPGVPAARIVQLAMSQQWDNKYHGDHVSYDLSQVRRYGAGEIDLFGRWNMPPAARQLMLANLDVHGFSRLLVQFSCETMRCSGDGHTTSGNTLWNGLSKAFLIADRLGRLPTPDDAMIFAGSDDCLDLYNGPQVDFEDGCARLGLPIEGFHTPHWHRLEFLGCRFMTTNKGRVLMPIPGKLLPKLGHSVRANPDTAPGIARGAALSLYAQCSGCPILAPYLQRVLALTGGVNGITPKDEPWRLRGSYSGEPVRETLVELADLYGWTQELQDSWVSALNRVTALPCTIVSPLADIVCAVDSAKKIQHLDKPDFCPVSLDRGWRDFTVYINAEPVVQSAPVNSNVAQFKLLGPDSRADFQWIGPSGQVLRDCDYVCDGMVCMPETPLADVFVEDECKRAEFLWRCGDNYGQVSCSDNTPRPELVRLLNQVAQPFGQGDWFTEGGLCLTEPGLPLTFGVITFRPRGLGGSGLLWHAASAAAKVALPATAEVTAEAGWHAIDLSDHDYRVALGDKKSSFSRDGSSYLLVASRQFAVSQAILQNMLYSTPGGKPLDYRAVAVQDFVVKPKGLGGSGVGRTERVLDRLTSAAGVLDTSRGTLLSTLDTFHDHEYRPFGWFDAMSAASVCELQKITFQITSAQGTNNWDANVVMFPDLLNSSVTAFLTQNTVGSAPFAPNFQQNAASATSAGGVVVYQNVAGSSLPMNTAASTAVSCLTPTVASGSGASRAFAYAIEVVNNTAVLNQQGTCTVWRQPMPGPLSSTTGLFSNTNTSNVIAIGPGSYLLCPAPPSTVAEAMLLQGSRQWHAKEGAYCINTICEDSNPPLNNQCIASMYYEDNPCDHFLVGKGLTTGTIINGTASTNVATVQNSYVTPFNMGGAYFSGLSPSTTLTVNVRVWFEFFPSQLGNVLTALAMPSAPYDERALRLYSEVVKTMPPGVMLCENGFGDWFKDVVGTISGVVGSVAGMIPHPLAQAVATVAKGVNSFVAPRVMGVAAPSPVMADGVSQEIALQNAAQDRAVARRIPQAKLYAPQPRPRQVVPPPRPRQTSSQLRAELALAKAAAKGKAKRNR
jgi:hypothetical protein